MGLHIAITWKFKHLVLFGPLNQTAAFSELPGDSRVQWDWAALWTQRQVTGWKDTGFSSLSCTLHQLSLKQRLRKPSAGEEFSSELPWHYSFSQALTRSAAQRDERAWKQIWFLPKVPRAWWISYYILMSHPPALLQASWGHVIRLLHPEERVLAFIRTSAGSVFFWEFWITRSESCPCEACGAENVFQIFFFRTFHMGSWEFWPRAKCLLTLEMN